MTPPRHLLPSEVTELGWYWVKNPIGKDLYIREVVRREGGGLSIDFSGGRFSMDVYVWLYGPLTPPEPPSPPLEQHAPHQL